MFSTGTAPTGTHSSSSLSHPTILAVSPGRCSCNSLGRPWGRCKPSRFPLLLSVPHCLQVSLPPTQLEKTRPSIPHTCSFPSPVSCPKTGRQLPSRSSASTLPQHAPRCPKQPPWHCSRQPVHLGQRDLFSLIPRSPQKAAQGSRAGPGLPQRCCGISLEGTVGSGH